MNLISALVDCPQRNCSINDVISRPPAGCRSWVDQRPANLNVTGPEYVSSGRQCRLRPHLVPLRRQCRLPREPLCPLRDRPHFGRCPVAGVLPKPEGRARPPHDEPPRAGGAAAPPP